MTRIKRLVPTVGLAAVLAAFTLSAGTATASIVPHDFYGIAPNTALDSGDYARMGAAKVGSLRFQILWSEVQNYAGPQFNWDNIDQTVGSAAQDGISLLPTMAG